MPRILDADQFSIRAGKDADILGWRLAGGHFELSSFHTHIRNTNFHDFWTLRFRFFTKAKDAFHRIDDWKALECRLGKEM